MSRTISQLLHYVAIVDGEALPSQTSLTFGTEGGHRIFEISFWTKNNCKEHLILFNNILSGKGINVQVTFGGAEVPIGANCHAESWHIRENLDDCIKAYIKFKSTHGGFK